MTEIHGATTSVGTMRMAYGVGTVGGAGEFNYLSPEMLMLFCRNKLRSLDSQMSAAFADQQARSKASGAIGEIIAKLTSMGKVTNQGDQLEDIRGTFANALSKLDPESSTAKELQAQLRKIEENISHGEGGVFMSESELSSHANAIGKLQEGMNKEGELQMLQLQTLMSQRQQALQLCTNMIQTLGQTANTIAGNIGK